jgi:cardiolipin synthase
MHEFLIVYWPHIVGAVALVAGTAGSVHAVMTKKDVRAAAGWAGVILLSPLIGAVIYLVLGINRIRRTTLMRGRKFDRDLPARERDLPILGDEDLVNQFAPLRKLGDVVAGTPLLGGNAIEPLASGDDCYAAMLAAIDAAKSWVLLQTYIFDNDALGRRFVQHLAAARGRGVEVRVLVDAIGSRYSRPPITQELARAGITHALFMDKVLGLQLVYANLRTHRKILVADGVGFIGGMNIRAAFSALVSGGEPAHDAHFRVEGPIASELARVFCGDWLFSSGELLPPGARDPLSPIGTPGTPVRIVPSGPDRAIEATHDMIMGVLSVAKARVVVSSPYFLPDSRLIAALAVAARRGVTIDIVLPGVNNLALVDCAMNAQLDQVIDGGCRVWRSVGPFDHSKLLAVDRSWAYVGSSNLDPRSMRLNFEIDMEAHDPALAGWIEDRIDGRIATADQVSVAALNGRPFWKRLRDKTIWLASPYL